MRSLIGLAFVLLAFIGFCPITHADPKSPKLNDAERLELEIYQAASKAQSQNIASDQGSDPQPVRDAEIGYSVHYFAVQSEMRELELAQFRWQLTASNVILWMVVVLAGSGTIFAGYQLYTGARHPRGTSTEMELSGAKIKLQTSVVGIVVLVISWAFLLLFVHDVYKIHPPQQASSKEPSL